MSTAFQLEDDVIAKMGYFNDMKTFATQEATKQWLFLEFSQLGFIGVSLPISRLGGEWTEWTMEALQLFSSG